MFASVGICAQRASLLQFFQRAPRTMPPKNNFTTKTALITRQEFAHWMRNVMHLDAATIDAMWYQAENDGELITDSQGSERMRVQLVNAPIDNQDGDNQHGDVQGPLHAAT